MTFVELAVRLAARINNLRAIQHMLQKYDGELTDKDIRLLADLVDCEEVDEVKLFLKERGDLESKTVKELREIASTLSIPRIWILTKHELMGEIECARKKKKISKQE